MVIGWLPSVRLNCDFSRLRGQPICMTQDVVDVIVESARRVWRAWLIVKRSSYALALCDLVRYGAPKRLYGFVFKRIDCPVRVVQHAHVVVLGNLPLVFLDKAG